MLEILKWSVIEEEFIFPSTKQIHNENLAEYIEDTTETNNKLKHKTRKGQATGSTDPLYSLPYGVLNQIVLNQKKIMYNYIPSFLVKFKTMKK